MLTFTIEVTVFMTNVFENMVMPMFGSTLLTPLISCQWQRLWLTAFSASMVACRLPLIRLIMREIWIEYRRYLMRVQCVILSGLIQMIGKLSSFFNLLTKLKNIIDYAFSTVIILEQMRLGYISEGCGIHFWARHYWTIYTH